MQLGFTPVFADIDLTHMGLDSQKVIDAITEDTRAIFVTHVQGFNALTNGILEELDNRNIVLLEDVCEAHGATSLFLKTMNFPTSHCLSS